MMQKQQKTKPEGLVFLCFSFELLNRKCKSFKTDLLVFT